MDKDSDKRLSDFGTDIAKLFKFKTVKGSNPVQYITKAGTKTALQLGLEIEAEGNRIASRRINRKN